DRTAFGPGTAWGSFAEQSRTTFRHAPGRLSIILTPPERFLHLPPDEVFTIVCADGERLGFDLGDHVTAYRVVAFPQDFYSLEPGNDWMRPPQRTPISGLTLAGDYTRQRFLASMEGAVISGQNAAGIVVGAEDE
ncbi:MAG: FAD-dependent oxidoreductase, partial [Actinomycetota bacterium]|nr:FAD-dependent oxidoreductase [Actinomycetota bacterium]